MSTQIEESTDLHLEKLEKKAISDMKDMATVLKISSVSEAYRFFKKNLEELAEEYNDLFCLETLGNGDHLFSLNGVDRQNFFMQLDDEDFKTHVKFRTEEELIFFEKGNHKSLVFKVANEYGKDSKLFPELLLNSSFKIYFLERLRTLIYYYSLDSSENVLKEIRVTN